MRYVLALALAMTATPVLAQSDRNASDASAVTSEAVGALAESGFKTSVGASAAPLAIGGVASVAVGASASAAGGVASEAAEASTDFSNEPLTVSDDIVVPPQAAPSVPFEAARQP